MTEAEIRAQYVKCAESYAGAKQGGAKHKDIVAIYNSYVPHPRGYAMTMNAPWCAAFVSAVAIITNLASIFPIECSCKEQIAMWQKMGRWEERDDYVPQRGDLLYYFWKDSGNGDCTDDPNHVGIVADVVDGDIIVIEGNKGGMVGYRHIMVDGKYIRGFGLPDYASVATEVNIMQITKYGCMIDAPVLQYGSKGAAVKAMQALLNLRYGWQLDIDGSFGQKTLRALKSYQDYCKIAVDGSCGSITWGRLING